MSGIETTGHAVLYVDDERDNLDAFRFSFRRDFEVHTALGGEPALELLRELDAAVLVVDQRMPGMTGIELLSKAKELRSEAVGIILTAYTDIEVLIQALNSNLVYRYMTKPWDSKEMRVVLRQAVERHVLFRENRRLLARLEELNAYLTGEIRERFRPGRIIGRSAALQRVLEAVGSVAPAGTTVLIRGESGTGKELFARALHENSPRANRPFIRVACAALSPGVLESELFGHEKGAFTGAHERKPGRFELADGGTLFLDEVGDLAEGTQVKLLRVLQEREFERVGGTRTLKMDVRVVAATHRNLEALVAQGQFREDLYYRLNVFPILLPPLRERREDIPLLADHFLERFSCQLGREVLALCPEAMQALLAYSWPGNVRELENLIERAVILARGPV
ncbi:MAG: sigma-54-dependent Fis family transcriptional regulator, partial [Deltaproteobacteria bacterium]|nr:sigma-54-dependent Fis family transcriptional regulator [Deltaproteobacteria bacterium]